MTSQLVRLLGDEASRFTSDGWPSEPICVQGAPERLPTCLQDPCLHGFQELNARYVGQSAVAGGRPGKFDQFQVPRSDAARFYFIGLTVFFDDLDRTLPGVADFKERLAADL